MVMMHYWPAASRASSLMSMVSWKVASSYSVFFASLVAEVLALLLGLYLALRTFFFSEHIMHVAFRPADLVPKPEVNFQALHRLHLCWCRQLVATHFASKQLFFVFLFFFVCAEEKGINTRILNYCKCAYKPPS